jgi:hypothetical protein
MRNLRFRETKNKIWELLVYIDLIGLNKLSILSDLGFYKYHFNGV